jgi:hypothetical protein
MARREPTSRLKSVDLPTLGRPTMASSGACAESILGFTVLDFRNSFQSTQDQRICR